MTKTRIAYGTHKATGYICKIGDTVKMAMDANMMIGDYEKRLIELNPQMDIKIVIEKI